MATSTQRDPRSIITPDAFDVATELVGIPLARPGRRAVALAIDGIVIALLTAVTKSFALILGVVAAAFFMRAGFKRTEVPNSVFGRAMRFSVGCLGLFIAVATASLWMIFGTGFGGDGDETTPVAAVSSVIDAAGGVMSGLGALGLLEDFDSAESIEEAEEIGQELVETARDSGIDDETIRSVLSAVAPEGVTWADQWPDVVARLTADDEGPADSSGAPAVDGLLERVADLSDAEALEAYAELLAAPDPDARLESALADRLGPLVAADTIAALRAQARSLERELLATETARAQAQASLEDATGGGVFGWVRDRLDDLGFGFGWAALYMTVFLSWWNGQTVGKRMMRIRVVRLDGEPINWWTAFERVGGYAAGFATGLLGFAQIWWDANRQAIHDRIVGTVVIDDAGQRVEDWESAL